MICGDDDQSVLPLVALTEFLANSTDMKVNLTNHAVILRAHFSQLCFGSWRCIAGEVHRRFVQWVSSFARTNGQVYFIGRVFARPLSRCCVWGMWSQITQVGKPWRAGFLRVEPDKKLIGEKS